MNRYDDIINLPHHVSPTRKRMSMHDRAAQFAPFAALVGYDAAVAETARLTEVRPELDGQEQKIYDQLLSGDQDPLKPGFFRLVEVLFVMVQQAVLFDDTICFVGDHPVIVRHQRRGKRHTEHHQRSRPTSSS